VCEEVKKKTPSRCMRRPFPQSKSIHRNRKHSGTWLFRRFQGTYITPSRLGSLDILSTLTASFFQKNSSKPVMACCRAPPKTMIPLDLCLDLRPPKKRTPLRYMSVVIDRVEIKKARIRLPWRASPNHLSNYILQTRARAVFLKDESKS